MQVINTDTLGVMIAFATLVLKIVEVSRSK